MLSISRIVSRSIFLACLEAFPGIRLSESELAFPQTNPGALLVSRTNRVLPSELLQSYPRLSDSSKKDCHNRSRAFESYISLIRKLGSGLRGELVFKLSTERF